MEPMENGSEAVMVDLKTRIECLAWAWQWFTISNKQTVSKRGQCLSVSIICKIKGNLYTIVHDQYRAPAELQEQKTNIKISPSTKKAGSLYNFTDISINMEMKLITTILSQISYQKCYHEYSWFHFVLLFRLSFIELWRISISELCKSDKYCELKFAIVTTFWRNLTLTLIFLGNDALTDRQCESEKCVRPCTHFSLVHAHLRGTCHHWYGIGSRISVIVGTNER